MLSSRQALRQQVRDLRRQLPATTQSGAALQLVEQFQHHPLIQRARRVALYLANDGELDTRAAIEWCWQQQIQVCLPVLHPFSEGHLLFLDFTPTTPMTSNRFGIAEPQLDCRAIISKSAIDVLFTPLVAFDALGNRLGMGGGFYDRALEDWKQNKKPVPVGLAHDCQQVEAIPTEHWDVPLPILVTPTKIWRWDC